MVAVINPPITTTANGFCVSLPMPWLTAAGNKPIIAINAVITTGRTLDITPSRIALSRCIFFIEVLPEYRYQYHTILNTYAK